MDAAVLEDLGEDKAQAVEIGNVCFVQGNR